MRLIGFLISGFEHEFRNLWVPLQNSTFSSRQFDENFQDPSVLGQRLHKPGIPKITWQDSCTQCSNSFCIKVEFDDDNPSDPEDYVCLKETLKCVYEGTFLHEFSSTGVTVTKGCPLQGQGILEASFKCNRVQGIRFVVTV